MTQAHPVDRRLACGRCLHNMLASWGQLRFLQDVLNEAAKAVRYSSVYNGNARLLKGLQSNLNFVNVSEVFDDGYDSSDAAFAPPSRVRSD